MKGIFNQPLMSWMTNGIICGRRCFINHTENLLMCGRRCFRYVNHPQFHHSLQQEHTNTYNIHQYYIFLQLIVYVCVMIGYLSILKRYVWQMCAALCIAMNIAIVRNSCSKCRQVWICLALLPFVECNYIPAFIKWLQFTHSRSGIQYFTRMRWYSEYSMRL